MAFGAGAAEVKDLLRVGIKKAQAKNKEAGKKLVVWSLVDPSTNPRPPFALGT